MPRHQTPPQNPRTPPAMAMISLYGQSVWSSLTVLLMASVILLEREELLRFWLRVD